MFPAVDPIPLPAPVWLFKALHIVTLSLHFAALHLLVGGLLIASIWGLMGSLRGDPAMKTAGGAVIKRLPVVMTYVINFGVPPLLFAQVLYGRAIYTSSVLIGFYWIMVIFLLMAGYWFLYVCAKRAEKGKSWGWIGLLSALLIVKIAAIYTSNMSLMLRPDVWQELYRQDPTGVQLAYGDPTVWPRFFFMLAGSLGISGVGMMLLGLKKSLLPGAGELLGRWGGGVLCLGIVLHVATGFWVMRVQPAGVLEGIGASGLLRGVELGWLATALLLALLGAFAAISPAGRKLWPVIGTAMVAFVNVIAMTAFRDGLRDISLLQHGYDVWNREVVTNWSVVVIFLVTFVVGLVVVGWMISVVARAKQEAESYA